MEKTLEVHLQEQREQIAKEIEVRVITWAKFNDGIPLHTNCWKCNTEPLTSTCDSARESWGKSISKIIAKQIREYK